MTGLEVHLFYVGNYYHYYNYNEDRLKAFVLRQMKKYEMKSVMMTMIDMWRWNLITNKKMDDFYLGNKSVQSIRNFCVYNSTLGHLTNWVMPSQSVNDDLESFFEGLNVAKVQKLRNVTYFLPKLTDEEHKLIRNKDKHYFKTFYFSTNPDVDEIEMRRSESKSKFVYGESRRRTYILVDSLEQNTFCSVL